MRGEPVRRPECADRHLSGRAPSPFFVRKIVCWSLLMKPIAQVIDGRRSMRTLADALVKLEKSGLLKEGDHATIRTCWMQLPDGAVVATVAVIAPGEQRHGVMLPSAARFTAKNTVGERRERDLVELDGAVADRDGNVQPAPVQVQSSSSASCTHTKPVK